MERSDLALRPRTGPLVPPDRKVRHKSQSLGSTVKGEARDSSTSSSLTIAFVCLGGDRGEGAGTVALPLFSANNIACVVVLRRGKVGGLSAVERPFIIQAGVTESARRKAY